jgi:MerR family redox-sensitive transcriptional activator SoxR
MKELTIGAVARQAGVAASTVRYYEQRGLLPPPLRRNGQRRYGATVVEQLRLIKFAQRVGFTLDEITTLVQGFAADTPLSIRWQALAPHKLRELAAQRRHIEMMQQVLTAGLTCACSSLDTCTVYQRCPA